jgi:hypothetical protein
MERFKESGNVSQWEQGIAQLVTKEKRGAITALLNTVNPLTVIVSASCSDRAA